MGNANGTRKGFSTVGLFLGANEEDLTCRLLSIPALLSETPLAPTKVSRRIITPLVAKQSLCVGVVCQSYITVSAVFNSGFDWNPNTNTEA